MTLIAHLSDLHIGPLPRPRLAELVGKRATGYVNWMRNRADHHSMAALDALIADIRAASPDLVAVGGDLVNIALPEEFDAARAVLERIGAPGEVLLVPGNHDAYVRSGAARMVSAWGPYFAGDHEPPPRRLADAFPSVRRVGSAAVVGVSTAIATPPFRATGLVGSRQIAALGETLHALAGEGLARIVLIHHPPFQIASAKRLIDHGALARTLLEVGAEAVLHGHTHKGTVTSLPGPHGPIPILGVPAASSLGTGKDEPAGWNLLRVEGAPGRWRISLRRRSLTASGAFAHDFDHDFSSPA